MLTELPVDDLRQVRDRIGEVLFEAGRPAFARVAALSKAVPGAVAANLTEAVLPPLIAARTAELMDPRRAAELVRRISLGYLAEVALRMDAARAPAVIAAIPHDRVGAVAAELARREGMDRHRRVRRPGDAPSAGGAVASSTAGSCSASAFVLDAPSRLDTIGELLSDEQIDEMLVAAAAARAVDEWPRCVGHLGPPRRARLAERLRATAPGGGRRTRPSA